MNLYHNNTLKSYNANRGKINKLNLKQKNIWNIKHKNHNYKDQGLYQTKLTPS